MLVLNSPLLLKVVKSPQPSGKNREMQYSTKRMKKITAKALRKLKNFFNFLFIFLPPQSVDGPNFSSRYFTVIVMATATTVSTIPNADSSGKSA